MMTQKQIEVTMKILYAVETGGQVYGKQNYAAFIGAGHNTANEKAITIGAGQWYATEAKRLLQEIQSAHPDVFKKLDTAGIAGDLKSANWSTYAIAATSAKAACIVAIISSAEGIQCQDALMKKQIQEYEKTITATYGEMSAGGMIECINITHQGGASALKRILAKTAKPYTEDTIYAALCTDPADKSNNNQVGDYTSRQKKVYDMIKTHLQEDSGKEATGMTEKEVRLVMANIMRGWIGLKRSDGSHMVIINLYNSCKPLPRGYAVTSTDAYCATTYSAAGIKAGYTDIVPRECGCGQMIELFQKMGRWVENDAYVPDIGDAIFYDWDDNGVGDCTGWPEHVGMVLEVNKSTKKMLIGEGNMSGGIVGTREIEINGRYIRGYGIPDFASKATKASGSTDSGNTGSSSESTSSGTSSSGGINKTPKWVGQVTVAKTAVRTWGGTEYDKIKSWPELAMGNLVDVCDTVKDSKNHAWYYVRIASKFYGFVDSSDIKQAGSASGSETKTTGTSAPTYKVGNNYTLQVELKVRVAPGTGSATKSYSQLTADGQKHDKDKDGCLDAGTVVTCQAVQKVGNDIWIKAPSGWMAAYYQGEKYIK